MATRIPHVMEFFGDHTRIIPVKFDEILPSGLGDVVKLLIGIRPMDCQTAGRTMDILIMITIAHLEPMSQVSEK